MLADVLEPHTGGLQQFARIAAQLADQAREARQRCSAHHGHVLKCQRNVLGCQDFRVVDPAS